MRALDPRRAAQAVAAAGALLVAAFLAIQVVGPDGQAVAVASPSSIEIVGPVEVSAGESTEIAVLAPVADRTDVSLGVFSALESTHLEAVAANGAARFDLEPELLDHEGRVTLVAEIGSTRAVHDLIVRSGPAVDPVVPLVGPRTIVADGEDFTMIVVSPVDEFGNPLPDGTLVATQVVRPDGRVETSTPVIRQGLAAWVLRADTTTGRTSITASVDGRQGPVNVVDQVAGRPVAFALATSGTNTVADQFFADGFTLLEVTTAELRDRFGNVLPDGVVVHFAIESPDGMSFAPATLQGGVATAAIEAPDRPGDMIVTASTSGTTSAPLVLSFKPAVESVPVNIAIGPMGTPIAQIGPVVTQRGGYPADGTLVTIVDAATGNVLAIDALSRGAASVVLRASAPGTVVRVEILGVQVDLAVSGSG